jgi:hypothetical protein
MSERQSDESIAYSFSRLKEQRTKLRPADENSASIEPQESGKVALRSD